MDRSLPNVRYDQLGAGIFQSLGDTPADRAKSLDGDFDASEVVAVELMFQDSAADRGRRRLPYGSKDRRRLRTYRRHR